MWCARRSRTTFFCFLCCGHGTWSDVYNGVLISLSAPASQPTSSWNTEWHQVCVVAPINKRIHANLTSLVAAASANTRIWSNLLCSAFVQRARSSRAAYAASAALTCAAARQPAENAQRNPPRARALRIAQRSACACVAQRCALCGRASLDRGRARVGRNIAADHT